MQKPLSRSVIILLLLSTLSCHHKPLPPSARQQAIETYRTALQFYRQNDLLQSEIGFRQSIKIDGNFAPAYEGLARIAIQKKDFIKAEQLITQTLRADHRWIPAYVLKAKIDMQRDAYTLALDELQRARQQPGLESVPELDQEIQLMIARCYRAIGEFDKAYAYMDRLIRQPGQHNALYEEWLDLNHRRRQQKIHGNLVSTLQTRPVLNRAELAVLLHTFLPVPDGLTVVYKGEIYDLPIDSILADPVERCARRGWLPVFPDSTIQAGDRVDHVELAIILDKIWRLHYPLTGQGYQQLRDVPKYLPWSGPVYRMVEFGILKADAAGYFHPGELVTGLQATTAIHLLRTRLESPAFPVDALRQQGPQTE